jgi:nucleotide-binding universal stress UspA family protein
MSGEIPAAFRIQLAVDGSEHSMAAAQLVGDLQLPPDSEITFLGVLTPGRPPGKSKLEAAFVQAEKILERSSIESKSKLLHGHPAKKIVEYGSEYLPDLMAIGAIGLYPILKILLGTTAYQVVENARWPVLVMRTPYRGLRRVLLATDGSQNSRQAAQYLARLPLPEQTELQVLHVKSIYPSKPAPAYYGKHPLAPPIPFMPSIMPGPAELQYLIRHAKLAEQKGETILAETKAVLQSAGRKVTTFLRQGHPAAEILKQSEEQDIDLIVTGPRGLKGLEAWGWDSVSRKLVDYASSSLLLVR